ncbi:PREDICTED: uncharacterized protein LOC102016182 [Chinchilla lanigera]|uniref:uncharacterized protein LOC102016182 n=1 Tax=Chinchilla lanigera TaxID=34839 RepID=UPI00038EC0F0|nr:PREDICTED: uncharacterized protein LOC102016182 [Chinchilla lanigera]XP_013370851.1 PREDICTED: uncharacterized protein LOC102016182 [Chinchilla lanigera]
MQRPGRGTDRAGGGAPACVQPLRAQADAHPALAPAPGPAGAGWLTPPFLVFPCSLDLATAVLAVIRAPVWYNYSSITKCSFVSRADILKPSLLAWCQRCQRASCTACERKSVLHTAGNQVSAKLWPRKSTSRFRAPQGPVRRPAGGFGDPEFTSAPEDGLVQPRGARHVVRAKNSPSLWRASDAPRQMASADPSPCTARTRGESTEVRRPRIRKQPSWLLIDTASQTGLCHTLREFLLYYLIQNSAITGALQDTTTSTTSLHPPRALHSTCRSISQMQQSERLRSSCWRVEAGADLTSVLCWTHSLD